MLRSNICGSLWNMLHYLQPYLMLPNVDKISCKIVLGTSRLVVISLSILEQVAASLVTLVYHAVAPYIMVYRHDITSNGK